MLSQAGCLRRKDSPFADNLVQALSFSDLEGLILLCIDKGAIMACRKLASNNLTSKSSLQSQNSPIHSRNGVGTERKSIYTLMVLYLKRAENTRNRIGHLWKKPRFRELETVVRQADR